ncbi:hypothetical protein FA95DRAFT_886909 [Auriscalpium vulgare]|uniref:Uncharacterized protein n=1 Tax=Auriscalpium vulgare TaxID=40419 RepID=A0ACB8R8X4_9AGAM|nr:hypothetical protein FA95DRAFT_886909 [Auriscalpium vulgare]
MAESALSMASRSTMSGMSFKTINSVASYKTRINQTITPQGYAFLPGHGTSMDATPAIRSMHQLLSHSRWRAPISYDIRLSPSARSVLDRTSRDSAVPTYTLDQPATEPSITAGSHITLYSDKLPWPVIVVIPGKRLRYSAPITNLDVLYAAYKTLKSRVTQEEWGALGNGSKAQRRIAAAYERRCTVQHGGWENGVLRVDWLGSKTHFSGIKLEVDASKNGVWKMVFTKP